MNVDVRACTCTQGVYSCFIKRLLRDHRQQHPQSSDSPLYICGHITEDYNQETDPHFSGTDCRFSWERGCASAWLLRAHVLVRHVPARKLEVGHARNRSAIYADSANWSPLRMYGDMSQEEVSIYPKYL